MCNFIHSFKNNVQDTLQMSKLFENIPEHSEEEIFDILHEDDKVKIERIVSYGQSSPEGFWYDQDDNEWVIIISGSAVVEYDDGSIHKLNTGDNLFIPAHQKHRVKETDKHNKTIWLAMFYK